MKHNSLPLSLREALAQPSYICTRHIRIYIQVRVACGSYIYTLYIYNMYVYIWYALLLPPRLSCLSSTRTCVRSDHLANMNLKHKVCKSSVIACAEVASSPIYNNLLACALSKCTKVQGPVVVISATFDNEPHPTPQPVGIQIPDSPLRPRSA